MKNTNKFLSVLLAFIMIISIIPMSTITASAAYENTYSNTGNQRVDILGVARTQIGNTNGSKYGSGAWCAHFVIWCARQSGIGSDIIATTGWACADDMKIPYYSRDSYTPKPGDIVFFNWSSTSSQWDHVGIVESVNSNGSVTTIEGNNNGAVRRVIYSSDGYSEYSRLSSIRGYGVPNYKDTSKPGKPILSVSEKNTSDKAVTFSWNRTENTSQYDLRIYNYGEYNVGAPYGIWDLNVTTTSGYHKLPAGKYAAYLTAVSASGAETPSEWITFDVVDPPEKSVLTATPGKMVTDGVSFTWTKAVNTTTYDLRVYNYGDYNVGAPYYKFGMNANTTSTTINLPVGKYSAYITAVASNGAGTPSEWITFTVSEPTINSNYPTNIKGYKMWIGETSTRVFDAQTLNNYYLDDNEITVVSIYTNDWAKIKHTVDGIEKTAYIPLGGIICEKAQPYKMYIKNDSNVYSRYTYNDIQSVLPKDAEVLVIGYYKTDLMQICYLKNGVYHMGWIASDRLAEHSSSDHIYTVKTTLSPTCTTAGLKTFTCECGDVYTETLPALCHNYESVVVAPTCTEQGYSTYTCECGHSYIDDYVDATGHNVNGDDTCDNCGETIEVDNPSKDCNCNCHKSGISNLFFKFALFFQKLLGLNKYCSCGVAHY